jgi:hypothetical protein
MENKCPEELPLLLQWFGTIMLPNSDGELKEFTHRVLMELMLTLLHKVKTWL